MNLLSDTHGTFLKGVVDSTQLHEIYPAPFVSKGFSKEQPIPLN
jgi:hypothetical protein